MIHAYLSMSQDRYGVTCALPQGVHIRLPRLDRMEEFRNIYGCSPIQSRNKLSELKKIFPFYQEVDGVSRFQGMEYTRLQNMSGIHRGTCGFLKTRGSQVIAAPCVYIYINRSIYIYIGPYNPKSPKYLCYGSRPCGLYWDFLLGESP